MLILHATWSLTDTTLFIWGEHADAARRRRRRKSLPVKAARHPYQAGPDALVAALTSLAEAPEAQKPAKATLLLPSTGRTGPLPSPELVSTGVQVDADAPALHPWRVNGLSLPPTDALRFLVAQPRDVILPRPGLALGADLRYWSLAAQIALDLLARQRFVPILEPDASGVYHAAWRPSFDDPRDAERITHLVEAMPPVCRALATTADEAPGPHALLLGGLAALTDAAVRDWSPPLALPRQVASREPRRWLSALFGRDASVSGSSFQLGRLFTQLRRWLDGLRTDDAAFRLCFRLDPPPLPEPDQPALVPTDDAWTLRYLLQARDDLSLLVPVEQVWRQRGETARFLDRRFDRPQERLLTALGRAARLFPPIKDSLRATRPSATRLATEQAYTFLRQVASLLESSGFGVLMPTWWNKKGSRLGVRLRLQAQPTGGSGILAFDNLVRYSWELSLGDERLTREEFEALAALKTPLVQVRGRWVELRPEQVEAAIRFWEARRTEGSMSTLEALRLTLGSEAETEGLPVDEVVTDDWLDDLLAELERGEQLSALPPPAGFVGKLRPYQERGYAWLDFLRRWGFGACLADDMGLGKTIQAITLLLREREDLAHVQPALLICPTSVIGNWRREVARFAPGLRVMVHHGSQRPQGDEFTTQATTHDLIITSYALARRDAETLSAVPWGGLILDEAQNIKNPAAKQTQVIRTFPANYRVALTGTPVENRLSEFWSVMQFLNPGYLGSQKRFRQQFGLPIERYRDAEATQRLKRLVGPFVLRRVKTDSTIIQDLPEKMEMNVYCTLTAEQATLYQAVVQDALEQVVESEGIQRRGLVLAMLLKLKQVCNHPAQFLGDGSALPGRSGKLARLTEMLDEALSAGDRALVFTQFAEMGKILQAHLRESLGDEVLFLHGGTPAKKRDEMVNRFQSPHGPGVFVLSLKAGGLGLNLTAANHVFHFDRWWNPAVENQATDRAFRIGQRRDVQVHKFVCVGTLEEHIDELIKSKKELAEMVIGAGEGWLTELSTDQLRDLVTLRRETAQVD
jgi:SNF2 family DNA or RNA helicase